MSEPQQLTSNSPYSFTSLRYWCLSCQRPFSQLIFDNNTSSQAHCPRCDSPCDPLSPNTNPGTPNASNSFHPVPDESNPTQTPPHIERRMYLYWTEVLTDPSGRMTVRAVRIPLIRQDQAMSQTGHTSSSTENTMNTDESTENADQHTVSDDDNFSTVFSELLTTFALLNGYVPVTGDILVEQFLLEDVNESGPPPASEEEINKLEEVRFNAGSAKQEESEICCSVCREDYQQGEMLVRLPCRHDYHKKCVSVWLTKHNSCPMCRHPI